MCTHHKICQSKPWTRESERSPLGDVLLEVIGRGEDVVASVKGEKSGGGDG